MKKKCSICGIEKTLEDYYSHPSCSDGKLGHCKDCHSKKSKKYYKKNNLKIKNRSRKWYKKNRLKAIKRVSKNYDYDKKREYDLVYKRKFEVVVRNLYLWIGYRIKRDKTYKNRKLFFNFKEFKELAYNSKRLKKIYYFWKDNGYERKYTPTVDRIDNDGDYILDNIQFLQMRENAKKRFTNKYKLI